MLIVVLVLLLAQGMIYGRGQYLLMVDADGATKISDMERLENNLKEVERDGMVRSHTYTRTYTHLCHSDTITN